MHFGNSIAKKQSVVHLTETGVDGQNVITLSYEDGRLAILNSGIYGLSDRQGIFYGSKGFMVVENINDPQEVKIYDKERKLCRTIPMPEQINGYEYEILETIDCIQKGKMECPSMRHADTLELRKEHGCKDEKKNNSSYDNDCYRYVYGIYHDCLRKIRSRRQCGQ